MRAPFDRAEPTSIDRVDRETIKRLMYPKAIAIAGASDTRPYPGALEMIKRGVTVYPINPRHSTVYGCQAFPTLSALDKPVDAVFSGVNARQSVDLVAEAARLGIGGVVVFAAGFDHPNPELKDALCEAAAGRVAVLGPNCNGLINVRSSTFMTAAPLRMCPVGGIGFVAHSGGFLLSMVNGARARKIGLSHLITCGNETVTDMVDYIEALIDDPDTQVIALALETIRRPSEFFAAAERARRAGKPVIALKLGKGARAREIARSHTGAIAGEPWVYEAAFRQAGIVSARDFPDLLDRVALFDLVSVDRWTAINGLAILSTSGGMSELASDICEAEAMQLPKLESVRGDIAVVLQDAGGFQPSNIVMNPIDLGGSVTFMPGLIGRAVSHYAAAAETDAVMFVHVLDAPGEQMGRDLLPELIEGTRKNKKLTVLASVEDGEVAEWADNFRSQGIAVGRGIRAAIRGLKAMDDFMRGAKRVATVNEPPAPPFGCPAGELVATAAGSILPFDSAMALLKRFEIPTVPYWIIRPQDFLPTTKIPFSAPFTVKLADIPHRTEVGAVDLSINESDLSRSIERLRVLARSLGAPADVIVQPRILFDSEAFFGVQSNADLGPMVFCGVGGTFVELLGEVTARLAPFAHQQATEMINELNPAMLRGFRGARPWDIDQLSSIAVSLGRLAIACRGWLSSLDINPLVNGQDGFVAVDALCIVGNFPKEIGS
jgi:acetate---CoA ligase (ADP-forming)